jgi:hypothetical protein
VTNIDHDEHDEQAGDERDLDERDERALDEQNVEEDTVEDEAGDDEQVADEQAVDEPAADRLQKPRRNSFRKAGPKLTPEAAARQGEVTTLAFKVLGRDQAIAFLNGHNDELAGRPIDIVVESTEGAARVTSVIEASRKA